MELITDTSIVASYYYPLLSRRRRAYFPGKLGGANILRERGSEIHPPSLSRRIPRRNFLQEPPASSPYLFPHIRACFIKIEGCSRSRVESVLWKARSLAPGFSSLHDPVSLYLKPSRFPLQGCGFVLLGEKEKENASRLSAFSLRCDRETTGVNESGDCEQPRKDHETAIAIYYFFERLIKFARGCK